MIASNAIATEEKPYYLRLGVGASFSENTVFTDDDCSSTSPAAFYGCGNGNDGEQLGTYGDYGTSAIINLGVGYEWNSWLRTEASFSYRPSFEFSGESNFRGISTDFSQSAEAEIDNYSAMLVGVINPVAIFTENKWVIDPLLSVGAGFSHNRIESMTYLFPKTSTITPEGSNNSFSWSLGAGFGYELTERVSMELMYNYSDLGKVVKGSDTMTIVRRSDNSIINDSIVIGETEADLVAHEVLLSVLWKF